MVALVVLLAEAALGLVNNFALILYVDRLGLTVRIAGRAISTFLLVEMLSRVPMGHLSDKVGRKPVLLFALCVAALVPVTIPLAMRVEPHLVVSLRLVDGLAFGALWPAALAAIADLCPPERRAQGMGVFYLAYAIGVAIGPAIGSLALQLNWFEATFFTASFLLLAGAMVVGWAPLPSVRHHAVELAEMRGVEAPSSPRAFVPVWAMLTLTFIQSLGLITVVSILPVLAKHVYGLSERIMGFLFLGPALMVAACVPFLGRWADRMGEDKAVKAGLGVAALFMWAFSQARNAWQAGVTATLVSLGYLLAIPAWLSLVASVGGRRHRGAAFGGMGTAQGAGAVLGPILGTELWERGHLLPLYAAAGLFSASFLLSLSTIRRGKAKV